MMAIQSAHNGSRGHFASRLGFILAAAGSAVGLGNIWRFPYTTGENGGGLFVIVYLICVTLIGVPILMSEIVIGRAAQRQPVGAFEVLEGRKTAWSGVGWLGVIAGFIILSYYVVVAGWAMDYTLKSFVNFTAPMKQQADIDAMVHRAKTPPDELRAMLVSRRAEGLLAERQKQISRQVRPSDWKAYVQLMAVADQVGGIEQAQAAFAEDPQRSGTIEIARDINQRIDAARADAHAEAGAAYANLSDAEIRKEAEDNTYGRRCAFTRPGHARRDLLPPILR